MALHGVVVLNKVMAANIDTLNRAAVDPNTDLDNGSLVILASLSSTDGEGEVWTATQPATATLGQCWMIATPEIPWTDLGNGKYVRGLSVDPRDFVNPQDKVMDVFKPMVGDIITLSAECVEGEKGSNGYAVATNAKDKLQWAAAAVSGLSLKLLGAADLSLATGAIDDQRITAYRFEVVAVA